MREDKKLMRNKVAKVSGLVGLIFLIFFIILDNGIFSIGLIINKFNPCIDQIESSFLAHCYNIYDVFFSFISATIFIISFIVLVIAIIYKIILRWR